MNRNHLALLHAVAQAGSISGAAAALRISQPAVSKQISELEASLGVRLLERLPRGCRLTEAGVILADYAGRCSALETDAERAIAEYRGLKRGRLALGASLTIGGYLLPALLSQFHRRCPHIELHCEIANTHAVQELLLQGAVDVGLTEGFIESDELDSSVFFHDELVAIAPARHPLLKKARVSVRDLCREPFIMREAGSGTRAVVESALRKKGFKVTPLLSLASPEAIKSVVAAGLGVAIVSRLIIQQELQTRSVAIIPVPDLTINRPLHLQINRHRTRTPAVQQFLKILQAVAGVPS